MTNTVASNVEVFSSIPKLLLISRLKYNSASFIVHIHDNLSNGLLMGKEFQHTVKVGQRISDNLYKDKYPGLQGKTCC